MNLIKNMIKIHQNLDTFNQTLIIIEDNITLTDFELDRIQMTKLLESEFESLCIQFGNPKRLSLQLTESEKPVPPLRNKVTLLVSLAFCFGNQDNALKMISGAEWYKAKMTTLELKKVKEKERDHRSL